MDRKRILIVDDEPDLVEIIKKRLEMNNYKVVVAYNGLEGLNKARTEKPDLIILDLMLPEINGFEVCRLLKYDDKFKCIPIIILSVREQEKDMKLGKEVGSDAYLTKPFDPGVLLEKIESLIQK